jgi:heptosyltransferase-2
LKQKTQKPHKKIRILILAGGGIGDILMTTPMFRAIKKYYPHSYLAVGVLGDLNQQLLAFNGNIDRIFAVDDKKFKGIIGMMRLVFFLKKSKYDYCFHNHIGIGRKSFLIPFLSGIKNRIGFNRENIVKKKGYKLLVKLLTQSVFYVYGDKRRTEKNLELLKTIGIEHHDYSYELSIPLREKRGNTEGIVGIHPGSDQNGKIKRWDIKKFNLLAHQIVSRYGYRIRFYIGPQERELQGSIDDCEFFEIVRENDIAGLVKNMAECRFFISNDSGLAHLASALEIPTVVIYGPTTKDEYILPAKNAAVEIENLECRPCFYSHRNCQTGKICMNEIRVKDVFEAFKGLM